MSSRLSKRTVDEQRVSEIVDSYGGADTIPPSGSAVILFPRRRRAITVSLSRVISNVQVQRAIQYQVNRAFPLPFDTPGRRDHVRTQLYGVSRVPSNYARTSELKLSHLALDRGRFKVRRRRVPSFPPTARVFILSN